MTQCASRRAIIVFCVAWLLVSVVLIVFINFIDVSSSTSEYYSTDPTKRLLSVQLVFRHGARTPADTYPNDPHINETFYPYGWGQLTNSGKKSLYNTGKWLRERYGQFLGKLYVPDDVWAQTTDVTRTKMSMAIVLAGLYPPRDTPTDWNEELNWQPIPTYSEPLDKDSLLLVRVPCPRYHEALEETFHTPEIVDVLKRNEKMFEELTNLTGLQIKTPDDVQSLYSTLRAEHEYGLILPEWTKSYFPDRLIPLTELSFIYNIWTDELKRLKGGPLLKKMMREWHGKISGEENRKIFLYTGHDSTVVNILSVFNVWKQQLPIYGMMAIFELLQDHVTGEYGVKIYEKLPTSDARPLIIPGCADHFCPIYRLVELTKNLIPGDFDKECIAKNNHFQTPPTSGP